MFTLNEKDLYTYIMRMDGCAHTLENTAAGKGWCGCILFWQNANAGPPTGIHPE